MPLLSHQGYKPPTQFTADLDHLLGKCLPDRSPLPTLCPLHVSKHSPHLSGEGEGYDLNFYNFPNFINVNISKITCFPSKDVIKMNIHQYILHE